MSTPLLSSSMSIVIDGSTLACATDFSLSVSKDLIDVTCLDNSGAKQQIPDTYGWSISFSGLRIQSSTVDAGKMSYDALANSLISSDASVNVYVLPDISANHYLSGGAFISSMNMDGGVGSATTFSGELAGTGALTQNTTA